MDNDKDIIFNSNLETLLWYYILYTIGSQVIDHIPMENISHSENDLIQRLFCGYWILYLISIITESID